MVEKHMMKNKKTFLGAVILLLLQMTSFGQTQRVKLINDFVIAKQKYHSFNGNVLVAERGRIIYTKNVGSSDSKTKRPLTSDSVFELASITKQFTAAAVMLCKERGLLSLDDYLVKYVPQLHYEGVTVRHMLTHTSGLPEQNELMYKVWDSDRAATNQDLIEQLIKHKPEASFKVGEDFKYSNTNYALLATIVERVSGQTFRNFMAKNFFGPLGMKNTRVIKWESENYRTIPHHTMSYIFDPETQQYRLPEEMPQWKKALPLNGIVGSRGVNATALDLLKWQESLKTGKILSRQSVSEMQSPQVQGSVDGSDAYGYGLAIKSIYGDTKIFHNGGWNGYWNSLQHFKDADRTIIVLSNNDSEKGLANAIAAILFDRDVALPSEHREIDLSPSELNNFVGTYEANGRSFSIENRDGKLYRVTEGGAPVELKPESRTKLFYEGSDRQIEFIFNKGSVERVFFISEGLKLELNKVK
jgi:CubicO group peptidase (beta-lactamase class C family)